MFTPNSEEQQFLDLSTKFRDELAHVDKQIVELKDRRDQLLHLLYGPGPVLTDEGDVEEDPGLALVHHANETSTVDDFSMKSGTMVVANPEDRVLRLIKKNQETGTSRAQINKALSAKHKDLGQNDIDNLLRRLKNDGKIISEGKSRAARWYLAE